MLMHHSNDFEQLFICYCFSGKETVHRLYGTKVALLAGDFMFAQSWCYLANLGNIEIIKIASQVYIYIYLSVCACFCSYVKA